jgi:hypothetical protein
MFTVKEHGRRYSLYISISIQITHFRSVSRFSFNRKLIYVTRTTVCKISTYKVVMFSSLGLLVKIVSRFSIYLTNL